MREPSAPADGGCEPLRPGVVTAQDTSTYYSWPTMESEQDVHAEEPSTTDACISQTCQQQHQYSPDGPSPPIDKLARQLRRQSLLTRNQPSLSTGNVDPNPSPSTLPDDHVAIPTVEDEGLGEDEDEMQMQMQMQMDMNIHTTEDRTDDVTMDSPPSIPGNDARPRQDQERTRAGKGSREDAIMAMISSGDHCNVRMPCTAPVTNTDANATFTCTTSPHPHLPVTQAAQNMIPGSEEIIAVDEGFCGDSSSSNFTDTILALRRARVPRGPKGSKGIDKNDRICNRPSSEASDRSTNLVRRPVRMRKRDKGKGSSTESLNKAFEACNTG